MKNPFASNVARGPDDFRSDWDVSSFNEEATERLQTAIKESDPSKSNRLVRILLGTPGTGKTHLFGRVIHNLEQDALAVFVGPINDPLAPERQVIRATIETLYRPIVGEQSHLDWILARLVHNSFWQYFNSLPPTIRDKHDHLGNNLKDSRTAVFSIVDEVKATRPYLMLAESMTDSFPRSRADILRAFVLSWSDNKILARRWLCGESLSDDVLEALGLGDPPSLLEILKCLREMDDALDSSESFRMFLVFDNIENVLARNTNDGVRSVSSFIIDLINQMPDGIEVFLSCLEDQWDEFLKQAYGSFQQRCEQPFLRLQRIKPDEGVEFIRRRLRSWGTRSRRKTVDDELWPFDEKSLKTWVHKSKPSPRVLLKTCSTKLEEWMDSDQTSSIRMDGSIERAPIDDEFLQLWQQELENISHDLRSTVYEADESRVSRAVTEVLRLVERTDDWLVQEAKPRLKSEEALRQGGRFKRYSCLIESQRADSIERIIVATSKLSNARAFVSYLAELDRAATEESAGVLLVHHLSSIQMGDKSAEKFDELRSSGSLRFFPLEENSETFHTLECFLRLFDQAIARDLDISGHSLGIEDYLDLVAKLRVLDHLPLLDQVFAPWLQKPPVGDGTAAVSAVAPTQSPKGQKKAPAPLSPIKEKPKEELVTEQVATAVSVGTETCEEWAAQIQSEVVSQLKNWRIKVECSDLYVGPRFARLMVRPQGSTTVSQVRNKAEDLKIRLEAVTSNPIIDAQPNGISIDVELPSRFRKVVRLSEMQFNRPDSVDQPLFPIGMDVSGQVYWGNFADSTSAHYLLAGSTGSGKSEFMRAMITGLAQNQSAEKLQFVLIDPKRLTFNFEGKSPYFKAPVAFTAEEALPLLKECFAETERRYKTLQSEKVKDLAELQAKRADAPPRIIVICDEFPDLVADADLKKELETPLKRLSAKARAAGIHLVLAAQRPEAKVVTPQIRSNLPGRVCLKVASAADSKIVLDRPDASDLLGNGDLFWQHGSGLIRLQGPLVANEELEDSLKLRD